MKLTDNNGSRREGEGAVAFTFRRGREIATEGLLGLVVMAGIVGLLALNYAVLALLAQLIRLLFGSH